MTYKGGKGRTRARDGHTFLSSSKRRSIRKHGELSARQYKKVIKGNRRYKKTGQPF